MINNDKWINSLPNINSKKNQELLQIDNDKWINTIPKKNNYNIPKKNNYNVVKKYSFMIIVFVCGLFFVSVVKNQTRILEREINYLKGSINSIEFNLKQATLDNEVITSPENISKLAQKYLEEDLKYYKKSQIKNLYGDNKILKKQKKKNNAKLLNKLPSSVKAQVAKKIKKKKEEIDKLQELYSDPKSIPNEVKNSSSLLLHKQPEATQLPLSSSQLNSDSSSIAIVLSILIIAVSSWGSIRASILNSCSNSPNSSMKSAIFSSFTQDNNKIEINNWNNIFL